MWRQILTQGESRLWRNENKKKYSLDDKEKIIESAEDAQKRSKLERGRGGRGREGGEEWGS